LAQEPLKNEKGCKLEGVRGDRVRNISRQGNPNPCLQTGKSFLMANQNTWFHFLREIWDLVPNYHILKKKDWPTLNFAQIFSFFCLHVICRSTIRTRKLPEI